MIPGELLRLPRVPAVAALRCKPTESPGRVALMSHARQRREPHAQAYRIPGEMLLMPTRASGESFTLKPTKIPRAS